MRSLNSLNLNSPALEEALEALNMPGMKIQGFEYNALPRPACLAHPAVAFSRLFFQPRGEGLLALMMMAFSKAARLHQRYRLHYHRHRRRLRDRHWACLRYRLGRALRS
jgi:hypothetical protein